MSDFLSANELAERLGKSKSWVLKKAKTSGWEFQIANGNGGECKLFKCPLLTPPEPTALQVADAANQAVFENYLGLTVENTMSSRIRAVEAHEKLTALEPIVALSGADRVREIEKLCKEKGIARGTVYRWLKRYESEGMHGLLRRARSDRFEQRVLINKEFDQVAFDNGLNIAQLQDLLNEFRAIVRGLWAQGGTSVRQVCLLSTAALKDLCDKFHLPAAAAKKACSGTLVDFVSRERRFARVAVAQRDAKGFYDRHTTAIERTRSDLEPGDVVFGDVSPCDIPVLQPDGSTGWARLIAWQDAATNMLHVTGYLAPKGSSVRREHVAMAFAAMCADAPWGIPKKLYLDNGSEYSWREMLDAWRDLAQLSRGQFEGAWDAKSLGDEAGRIYRSIPFKPRAKSLEGQFSNLLHLMGWHKSFAGSDRMRKKVANLGKAVAATSLDDLKAYIGQIIPFYHSIPQAGHLKGKSPIEKMAEFQARGFKRAFIDDELLLLAFTLSMQRRVTAGCIKIDNTRYYNKLLHQYDGEMLDVRFGKHAPDSCFVFIGKRLLCIAAPAKVFAFTDPKGAMHAHKLAREARAATKIMEGQVAWLDPRELMGEFARLQGVDDVIAASKQNQRRVELSDEAQAMLAARQKALDSVLVEMEPQTNTIKRFDIEEAPEVKAARAMGL